MAARGVWDEISHTDFVFMHSIISRSNEFNRQLLGKSVSDAEYLLSIIFDGCLIVNIKYNSGVKINS